MNTTDTHNTENTARPFGYWLKATDRLMAAEFARAFENDGASRRDWRMLNIVDGTVPGRGPLHSGKPRGNKLHDHKLHGHKLHQLVERGWIAADGDGWTLTEDGRAAKDRLGARVNEIRAKVTDVLSDEEMATTLASLEKIARAFGWDEETPLPRGRRHGFPGHERDHGFPGHERGFGRRFGHREHTAHGHPEHGQHHSARNAQRTFERGFDAGFSRGRDA